MGRRFAPYKRFCRRRKPWRRANLLRPSILNNRVPIVCVGTQWEAGRRGRVSRHEGFLQPEVSFLVLQQSRPTGRLCFFSSPSSSGPHLGEPQTSPTQWVVWGEEEQGSAAKFLPQAETEQSGLCDDEGAAPEGAYKRFRRRRKPWRRANSLRPSILNNRVPIVCHRTQWEAGRHRSVSRHERFLQPEVSFPILQHSRPLGGCVFSCPFTPCRRRNR